MKRIVAGIAVISILIGCGLFILHHQRSNPPKSVPLPTPLPTQTETALPSKTITYGDQTYAYDIIKTQAATIFLIPNFTEKTSVQSIIDTHQCAQAVNGGFYDTKNIPLGFFASDTYTHPLLQSALFNGYFTITNGNDASIASSLSVNSLRIGLQSGPVLFMNSQIQPLRIQNDENARRIIVGVTNDDTVLFIVLYTQDSSFNGPQLTDLPSLIEALNSKESLHIVSAMNLDGESASAFYSADTKLSELTPVGSIFCIRN